MRFLLPIPFSRLLGPGVTITGVLAVVLLVLTGRLDINSITDLFSSGLGPAASDVVPQSAKKENVLTIATFNIQVFGETKVGKEPVMVELARICKLFDVIAIQEVRSPAAEPIQKLVKRMNEDGSRYSFALSSPIGRSTSPTHTEQYAFVFDTTRVRITSDPNRVYVMNDELDRMHREPFVASFTAIPSGNENRQPFSFTLINVHTDPDEVSGNRGTENELDVLADVFVNVRAWEYSRHGEDDFILLGDLNTSADRLYGLARIPGLKSLTGGQPTNTPGTRELDHILVDTNATTEYTRQANVLDLTRDLNIPAELAAAISDHRPVWAQFSAFEVPPYDPSIAATNSPVR